MCMAFYLHICIILFSSTHVLCTFSNICQHFCEILEIVKPFLALPALFFPLISLCICLCGATYLSINVGPQIVMGNRRLFSFVSGASNNCLLPRGRRFIVAEQTMWDYTYVVLNSKWTTWWLPCSCRAVCVLGGLMRWKDWQWWYYCRLSHNRLYQLMLDFLVQWHQWDLIKFLIAVFALFLFEK